MQHLRKLLHKKKNLDYSQWLHLINGTEFMSQFNANFLPYEARKVIASVYRSSTLPLARDMHIWLLRNNLYTRKLLHNMKILPDPHCHLCPQEVECRIHRFWSFPHLQRIWKFINKVLEETMDSPIFEKEAI